MTFEELKDKALSLPYEPGFYLMQDKTGTVIYVGKAKKLKNRVSQYFQDTAAHTPKTRKMVSQIDHFDTIVARSEFEALVLECSLIKRHMPKYNILLKDDKGYPYLRVDLKEEYPVRLLIEGEAEDLFHEPRQAVGQIAGFGRDADQFRGKCIAVKQDPIQLRCTLLAAADRQAAELLLDI